jgi:hypothetical protein
VKLLVSVVSAEEARRALAGGADIVDVKDPREGPLGAPAPQVLSEVVQAVGDAAPVSVALGDLPDLPHAGALDGVAYIKVGLRGAGTLDCAVAVMSAVTDAAGPHTAVIAATYADGRALDPPALAPAALPKLVERTGIAGALVDTFVKDGYVAAAIGPPSSTRSSCRPRSPRCGMALADSWRLSGVRRSIPKAELRRLAGDLHQPRIRVIRVPEVSLQRGRRTVTATPVRRTASGR